VFEEAAVDLGRALARYAETKGQVGFPRHRRKGRHRESFRLRNKKDPSGRDGIRVGEGHPRSVTLLRIGTIRVHDDTRRLRRMLRPSSTSTRASARPWWDRAPESCPRRSPGALPDGRCA
jgi:putative transposase